MEIFRPLLFIIHTSLINVSLCIGEHSSKQFYSYTTNETHKIHMPLLLFFSDTNFYQQIVVESSSIARKSKQVKKMESRDCI